MDVEQQNFTQPLSPLCCFSCTQGACPWWPAGPAPAALVKKARPQSRPHPRGPPRPQRQPHPKGPPRPQEQPQPRPQGQPRLRRRASRRRLLRWSNLQVCILVVSDGPTSPVCGGGGGGGGGGGRNKKQMNRRITSALCLGDGFLSAVKTHLLSWKANEKLKSIHLNASPFCDFGT